MSKTTLDTASVTQTEFKLNKDKKVSRTFFKVLQATTVKGVQVGENNTPLNPDVFAMNTENVKDLLVQFYYDIEDAGSLDITTFNELYEQVEKLNPMGLKKAGE